MNEIDDNATEFKIGKKVGRKARVKNATKVEYNGLKFDSILECNCYKILEESGLGFIFKPEKLVLCPGFSTNVLSHSEENEKELRSSMREFAPDKKYISSCGKDKFTEKLYRAECKKDQSSIKRLFNVEHRKVLRIKKILPVTWSPDFFLIDYGMYVESKGFANETFPVKFKIARWQLGLGIDVSETDVQMHTGSFHAIEVGSKKELNDLIAYLKK